MRLRPPSTIPQLTRGAESDRREEEKEQHSDRRADYRSNDYGTCHAEMFITSRIHVAIHAAGDGSQEEAPKGDFAAPLR